jgi:hypothetical protein
MVDPAKDRVRGIAYGSGEPFELPISQFIADNADDFSDENFLEKFLWDLGVHGVFQYPACMEDVPIYLVKGNT